MALIMECVAIQVLDLRAIMSVGIALMILITAVRNLNNYRIRIRMKMDRIRTL